MSRVCDNQSYEHIEKFVKQDLSIYGQDNPCPKSLTVVNGNLWRHYELGAILGFVIYNEFLKDPCDKEKPAKEHFKISTIHEDDENWFAPRTSMLVDAGWINAINTTWKRVVEWQKKHLIMGWDRGADVTNPDEYKNEQKESIVPEVISWEDEEPDNAVLGTKYCFNNELNMDNKWHYIKNNDYPKVFGEYEKQHYPQIPCLIENNRFYGIRYWNVTEQCWDDEECDDYFCNKDQITRWRYLDPLLNEK